MIVLCLLPLIIFYSTTMILYAHCHIDVVRSIVDRLFYIILFLLFFFSVVSLMMRRKKVVISLFAVLAAAVPAAWPEWRVDIAYIDYIVVDEDEGETRQ